MSEEQISPEGETDAPQTRVQLTSVEEGVNIADAKTIRLTVEGENEIVAAAFEVVMAFLQMALGGVVDRAENSNGEDITDQFRPATVDPFDFDFAPGDDPVA